MKIDRFMLISHREILERKLKQAPKHAVELRKHLNCWLGRLKKLILKS